MDMKYCLHNDYGIVNCNEPLELRAPGEGTPFRVVSVIQHCFDPHRLCVLKIYHGGFVKFVENSRCRRTFQITLQCSLDNIHIKLLAGLFRITWDPPFRGMRCNVGTDLRQGKFPTNKRYRFSLLEHLPAPLFGNDEIVESQKIGRMKRLRN